MMDGGGKRFVDAPLTKHGRRDHRGRLSLRHYRSPPMTEPAGSFMSTATSDAVLAWSVITGIGGLFGFASSIFLVYDRPLLPKGIARPIESVNSTCGTLQFIR